MKLPSLLIATQKRPGVVGKFNPHHVPNHEYREFWTAVYGMLRRNFEFQEPVKEGKDKVNPYFGYFGDRFHPIVHEPHSFHLGLDFSGRSKTTIKPIFDGVLEYSGFDLTNGQYVFLSHPDIVTEDGFVLHSIYMHLKKFFVKFSSYEKMLREISHNTYPKKMVDMKNKIGEMGCTGNSCGSHPHLHFQMEFRHPDRDEIIVVDPVRILGIQQKKNKTSKFDGIEDFVKLHKKDEKSIKEWKLQGYWSSVDFMKN